MVISKKNIRRVVRESLERAREIGSIQILNPSERKLIDNTYQRLITQIKQTPELMDLWQQCRESGREYGAEESDTYRLASRNAEVAITQLPIVRMIARVMARSMMRFESVDFTEEVDEETLCAHIAKSAILHSMPFYSPAQWDSFSDVMERSMKTLALGRFMLKTRDEELKRKDLTGTGIFEDVL